MTPSDDFNALDALYVAAQRRGDQPEADKIEAALSKLVEPYPATVPTLNAALWYASQGWPVFRTQPRLKVPYDGTRGLLDATCDERFIKAWFYGRAANVAIATGHAFDVVDVDPEGHSTMINRLEDDPRFAPLLGVAQTPRGGFHLLVPATGRGNTQGRWPGIDYRGKGGYIMAAPSFVDDEKSHGSYRWLLPPTGGASVAL